MRLLTIGGFDPCSGAGITADLRHWEVLGAQGMAVMTCNTVQVEDRFEACESTWSLGKQQLNLLLDRYSFDAIKIGLMANQSDFLDLLQLLKTSKKLVPVIWDPILAPSAQRIDGSKWKVEGGIPPELLDLVGSVVDLWTPNADEWVAWGQSPIRQTYLKGGHRNDSQEYVEDQWLVNHEVHRVWKRPRLSMSHFGRKHGSGCLVSALLAWSVVRTGLSPSAGDDIQGKVQAFFKSTETMLGRLPIPFSESLHDEKL